MINIYKFLGLIIVVFFAAISCKKEVTKIDLTSVDDKIVMQSYLCPQNDSIYVSLTIASGVLAKRKKITVDDLKAANVSIGNNGTIKTIAFKESIINFLNGQEVGAIFVMPQTEMPLVSGQTYTIKVSNGSKFEAFGSTTIPSADFIDFQFTVSEKILNQELGVYYRNLDFIIPDIKNQNNDYLVGTYNKSQNYFGQLSSSKIDLSDSGDTKNEIIFNSKINENIYQTDSVYLFVSNITVDYYKFQQSLWKALSNGNNNPFAEPSIIYTNVVGGYGLVGSMVLSMKPI